jgi:hypothetical protein
MRILYTICAALVLTVGGFCVTILALPEKPSDAEMVTALERVDESGHTFAEAWNDWATHHDKFTISVDDKKRFSKVRKLWKEFDRLSRNVEY